MLDRSHLRRDPDHSERYHRERNAVSLDGLPGVPTPDPDAPKHLDEEVTRLHLEKIGANLTVLTESQAAYLGVDVAGPYKDDTYRY